MQPEDKVRAEIVPNWEKRPRGEAGPGNLFGETYSIFGEENAPTEAHKEESGSEDRGTEKD